MKKERRDEQKKRKRIKRIEGESKTKEMHGPSMAMARTSASSPASSPNPAVGARPTCMVMPGTRSRFAMRTSPRCDLKYASPSTVAKPPYLIAVSGEVRKAVSGEARAAADRGSPRNAVQAERREPDASERE